MVRIAFPLQILFYDSYHHKKKNQNYSPI